MLTRTVSSICSTGLAARLLLVLLVVVVVLVLVVVLLLLLFARPVVIPLTVILPGPPPEPGVGVRTVSILMVLPVRVLVGHPANPYAVDLAVLICERLRRACGVPDVGELFVVPHRALGLFVVRGWCDVEVKRVVHLVVVMGVAIV